MARAYLGAVSNHRDCRGTTGSVLGTLRDGAVVGIGDGSTLGNGAVVGICVVANLGYGAVVGIIDTLLGGDVVWALVGRDVSSIPCRVFIAYICSPPTTNGDDGAGLLSASTRSSTDWRAASADECFGTRKLCGKIPLS